MIPPFFDLVGIGVRANSLPQQYGEQNGQVQGLEKASFHGLSARLNMNGFSLFPFGSLLGIKENAKMEWKKQTAVRYPRSLPKYPLKRRPYPNT